GFVKQSGGRLGVDSQLGYGTRIELQLPVARDAARGGVAPGSKPAPRGHESVLVVEDESEVRGIAVAFLRSLGYSVSEAASAPEALRMLAAPTRIDLLFSDVVLGSGMTGNELALESRRMRPGLRVLLTSGYERGALESDAPSDIELLRKPYRREELSAALRRTLERD